MLVVFLVIVVGLILLVWSLDKFVDGVVGFVSVLGMLKVMIGLIIVVFGIFVLEIVVFIMLVLFGVLEFVFGNVIGFNIVNIGLVLGVIVIIVVFFI